MWGHLLLPLKHTAIAVFIIGFTNAITTSSSHANDLGTQESIVERALTGLTEEEKKFADGVAKGARWRIQHDLKRSGKIYWAPVDKAWCAGVIVAPRPDNLVGCARAAFGVLLAVPNPLPSFDESWASRLEESLMLVRSAMEITGGQTDVPDAFRIQMMRDAKCLRGLIKNREVLPECDEPYNRGLDEARKRSLLKEEGNQ